MTKDQQIQEKLKEISLLKKERDNLQSSLQRDAYMYKRTSITALSQKLHYRRLVKDNERELKYILQEIDDCMREIDRLRELQ